MGPPRCFSRLGGLCSGAMFPSGWGHSALTGHTQEWGSLSDVLSPILPKKLIEPQEPAPSPNFVSSCSGSWSRAQAWRKAKGETPE